MEFSRWEYCSGLPFPSPGDLLDQTWVFCIAGRFFTIWSTREAQEVWSRGTPWWGSDQKVHRETGERWRVILVTFVCVVACMCAQSYLTLCDPMEWGPSGSSVHGILQARILECVAISSSRGSSQLRDQTRVSWVSCIGRQILYHCVTW